MTHWGWYWKVKTQHTPKPLCSQVPRLDSFAIAKDIKAAYGQLSCCVMECNGVKQRIAIEWQPCHIGGWRTFFRCPCCGVRVRMLYFVDRFGCRKCLRLGYYTQRQVPSNRYLHMYYKVITSLKECGGSLTVKPLGMHTSTWRSLVDRAYVYDEKYEEALYHEAYSLNR